MNDWKGNEIEVGHTVALIQVSTKFYESGRALERLNPEQAHVTRHPHQSGLWAVRQRYHICSGFEGSIVDDNTKVSELPISMIDIIKPQPFEILAIEGVSDNKEEYYSQKP